MGERRERAMGCCRGSWTGSSRIARPRGLVYSNRPGGARGGFSPSAFGSRPDSLWRSGPFGKPLPFRVHGRQKCAGNMGAYSGREIMRIEIKKFGEITTTRPEGREAYLVSRAYLRPARGDEPIELDFEGVKVLTPSWADE